MKERRSIHEEMFLEMEEKTIFNQAQEYAYEYLDKAFKRHVFPPENAIEGLAYFDEDMPESPTKSSDVLEALKTYGSPATVSQIGGRYFGFVCGGIVPAGLAAKWLADFWDQNSAMHVLSPIASKLETIVEKWLRQLFHLPERTAAGFVSGSSSATFCGLAAARYRVLNKLGWDVNEKGLFRSPRIRIVVSKHAHSSVIKAIGLLGFGKENIEWVDVDTQGRVLPGLIPELDESTILVLQAGNVNSGAFDAFEEICEKANTANAWVHIDGAFGLWAGAVEKLRYLTNGIEKANSWAVDGHKTLNTPYDCGIVLCEDREALVSSLHMTGPYIILSEVERDGMLFTPEMSRRARIIELWATMKYLGKKGIDELVYGLHERAVQFAHELQANDFEVLNDVVFNQVLVYCGTDELTTKTLKRVQDMRECWCGGSIWDNRNVIRISVCSWATTSEDISRSVKSFVRARNEIQETRHGIALTQTPLMPYIAADNT
ncbi:MAG: aminotransferase class V-fold PLP-dependent enzyme [Proteobacteria bacterium]|nr:aminotransferase class V-fold PLP-dependent enzyme [Pseudomonadota bacterium]